MTASELSRRLMAGERPVILDVRTPQEFAEGHIPNAVNIPFTQIGTRVRELDGVRDAGLVVYCGHGPRAWIAARALRRAGFTVDYVKGHMAAWRRAGLPEEH